MVRPGDKIIVSDQVATHGIAIMSVREGLEFETAIESDTRLLFLFIHCMDTSRSVKFQSSIQSE